MLSRTRALPALLAVIGLLVLVLVILRSAVSGTGLGTVQQNDHVTVVGVAGLSWQDISAARTPQLWKAADLGGTGLLTTRAARSVTCPWDGWLTLGAGNRARYPAPMVEDELAVSGAAVPGCLEQVGRPPGATGSQIRPAITENDLLGFGAKPGLLGQRVPCTSVIGAAPVLAVAAPGADVREFPAATSAAGWQELTERCPLSLVQAPSITAGNAEQLAAVDRLVGLVVDGVRRSGGTVIIAGVGQSVYQTATLHPVIAVGPGFARTVLSAPSTGRTPYLELIDLAPTALAILGQTPPADMAGGVITTEPRQDGIGATVTELRELAGAASAHLWTSKVFFVVLSVLSLLGCLFVYAGLRLWPRLRRYGGPTGVVIGLLPAAGFLANIVPWWLVGTPGPALGAALAVVWAALSAVSLLGPWRVHAAGPSLCAAALTAGILAIDVLTGSHLQLNSPLGYDAIVAGRFTGFGNVAFAVFAAAALITVAGAAAHSGGRVRRIVLVVAALGLATVAVDGAPGVGADFGGVVALFPALVLLAMIATGTRVSVAKAVLALVGGAVLVGVIAVGDYLRPVQSQTHLGRFVGQILNGTALTIIERKLDANLRLIRSSVLTLLVIGLLIVLALLWWYRGRGTREWVRAREPFARAGLIGVGVTALVGFAVNDSGIAVVAGVLAVAVPLLLAALARDAPTPSSTSRPLPPTQREADPVSSPDHMPAEL